MNSAGAALLALKTLLRLLSAQYELTSDTQSGNATFSLPD